LYARPDGSSGLALVNALVLASDAEGTKWLQFVDGNKTVRVGMVVQPDGTPSIGVHGKDGKSGLALADVLNNVPSLTLYDSENRSRLELALHRDGAPDIVLSGTDGQAFWKASTTGVAGSPSPVNWILWHQVPDGKNMPYGAWPTKEPCEASAEFSRLGKPLA
jgi:hypothetical protein